MSWETRFVGVEVVGLTDCEILMEGELGKMVVGEDCLIWRRLEGRRVVPQRGARSMGVGVARAMPKMEKRVMRRILVIEVSLVVAREGGDSFVETEYNELR